MKVLEKAKGSRSTFRRLTQRKGFKSFKNLLEAKYAHHTQTVLSMSDLAPKVYGEIQEKKGRWGYYTEFAKTITCNPNHCTCGKCEDIEEAMQDEIDDLVGNIEDCGYLFSDCHVGNVGYVTRNGKSVLVCIDTGEESLEEL